MKITALWDVLTGSVVDIYRYSGETICLRVGAHQRNRQLQCNHNFQKNITDFQISRRTLRKLMSKVAHIISSRCVCST
jgi:hypothetical protein